MLVNKHIFKYFLNYKKVPFFRDKYLSLPGMELFFVAMLYCRAPLDPTLDEILCSSLLE